MKPKTFNEACGMVAKEIYDLVISKQHDYGKDNILGFGEMGLVVRIYDKVSRLRNLVLKGETPKNETTLDTWQDIAGYAIIALMLSRGEFTLELEVK